MPEIAFFRHGEELLRVALGDRLALGRAPEALELLNRLRQERPRDKVPVSQGPKPLTPVLPPSN